MRYKLYPEIEEDEDTTTTTIETEGQVLGIIESNESEHSCEIDSDCVPMAGCHPKICINKKHAGQYEKPTFCTEIFNCKAAYELKDCGCEEGLCVNMNLGNQCTR